MRVAVIDLGTNKVYLLIADVIENHYHIIKKKKIFFDHKNSFSDLNKSEISEDMLKKIVKSFKILKEIIHDYHVDKIQAKATSMLRTASNRKAIVATIQQITNIKIDIISGEEEAQYIYQGVCFNKNIVLPQNNNKVLIVDIGGGSVELIICNKDKIFWQKSYEIGLKRLKYTFHHHEPIAITSIQTMNQFLTQKLHTFLQAIAMYAPTRLIGTSGTFAHILKIYQSNFFIKNNNSFTSIPIQHFKDLYSMIVPKNRKERTKILGICDNRVDIIVVACILINFFLQKSNINCIENASGAFRLGILSQIIR